MHTPVEHAVQDNVRAVWRRCCSGVLYCYEVAVDRVGIMCRMQFTVVRAARADNTAAVRHRTRTARAATTTVRAQPVRPLAKEQPWAVKSLSDNPRSNVLTDTYDHSCFLAR